MLHDNEELRMTGPESYPPRTNDEKLYYYAGPEKQLGRGADLSSRHIIAAVLHKLSYFILAD